MEQVLEMLHKIKDGVAEQDWEKVCQGYNEITGGNIKPPRKLSPIEQLENMIGDKPLADMILDDVESEPPRKLRSNEFWDGEKIRRKKKEKLDTSSKKVGTRKTNRVAQDDLINVSTNIAAGDNSMFAKEGQHTGPVHQKNPIFLDAAQIIGKTETKKDREEYEELQEKHQRNARPAIEFVDVKCEKCSKGYRVPSYEIPTAVGSDSEICGWRCRKCAGKPRG